MDKNYGVVEHVAIQVSDIKWHIEFFKNVFGMKIDKAKGDHDLPEIAWLSGGIQLINKGGTGNKIVDHVGIVVSDFDKTIIQAQRIKGISSIPGKGKNWILLPDGLVLELIQGEKAKIIESIKNPLR